MFVWGKKRMETPKFPDRRLNGEIQTDEIYTETLREFAKQWVEFFIRYYEHRTLKCRVGATLIRTVAFTAMVLGGVILVCRMLSSGNQTWLMQSIFKSELKEVPAEIGLILFALAAGMMAADRFANISENWMRYVITTLSLRRMLVDFQLASVVVLKPVLETKGTNVEIRVDPVQAEFDRIKVFLGSVFEMVRHETQEWADEFRKNRSELESYLKVQEAALNDKTKRPKTR